MAKPTFQLSEFQKIRQKYIPVLPHGLQQANSAFVFQDVPVLDEIREKYPAISAIKYVEFQPTNEESSIPPSPLRIGVVLSGGQASGGHNVIMGVFDYVKRHHSSSQVFGFLGGPRGIYTNQYIEIDEERMAFYRNQGGFDMICSGRDKIETDEQYANSLNYCSALNLDGLIVIGGDDSNTNAALLAEYFISKGSHIKVIGCPKTIDGDLRNEFIEVSFGFDTATKTYSEVIGNVLIDAVSSKKYYHFIRLMGRSASHIALECELKTRANLVLIGEEVQEKNMTLSQIVDQLATMIVKRGEAGKSYGVILVPEGLIEFIPEVNALIKELNEGMAGHTGLTEEIVNQVVSGLSESSRQLYHFLPESIRNQLMLDRDPHGNVQVAKIETERLLMMLLETELPKRGHRYPFLPQSYYFGYEGRSSLPSNFDANYCYALGNCASALIKYNFTGCMAVCRGIDQPPENWKAAGCPLAAMMHLERRKGKDVAVIKKALVEMDSPCFKAYESMREHWMYNDCYRTPGPIQFDGVASTDVSFLLKPPTPEDLASSDDTPESFPYYPRKKIDMSPLAIARMHAQVDVPEVFLHGLDSCQAIFGDILEPETEEVRAALQDQLPFLCDPKRKRFVEITKGSGLQPGPLKIGVFYLGRQTPGAHNVIDGLLLALESRPDSELYGFLDGNIGLFNKNYFKITAKNFLPYRNQGGMDFLGRSGDAIRGAEQFRKVKETCEQLDLDGLVVVGATHSLTDAAYLADYFITENVKTKIIGIPASIDANISHRLFETTIGFDTASRLNAQMVGNMITDSASAIKYWYFVRLMGRDPSHLVLECALQTHPNAAIISEFFKQEGYTLIDIVKYIADIVCERASMKKHFGTLLVPEGLTLQISHYRELISDIGVLMGPRTKQDRQDLAIAIVQDDKEIDKYFNHISGPVLKDLPKWFQYQLLTRIDSNGQVQLSLIETERLLADLVAKELRERKKAGTYNGSFAPVCHFFGYQGRCSMPTVFDCSLATTYGATAAALISAGVTGYMTTARGLSGPVEHWRLGAIPISAMVRLKGKSQYGRNRVLVPSAEVDLHGGAFQKLLSERRSWGRNDLFSNPGPIQYFSDAKYLTNQTLQLNYRNYLNLLEEINTLCGKIQQVCRFGVSEDLLRTAVIGLSSVEGILKLQRRQ
ncbi:unnamed protein product [Blepharisma stoltei]|uniref:Pyrophosphate--fructose 6-phosphate 1-phosphotransferase n=1 Tax=Blepharisma stoltei TaxID=1481888 RepID=A0AAU9JRM6_9CILI|nr:unnamed protein product [Blepharisma stoltei]